MIQHIIEKGEFMNHKVSERNKKIAYALLFLSLALLLINFYLPSFKNDDLKYLNRLNTMGYFHSTIDHYQHWSSRVIIEFVLMFLSQHFTLWKLLNAFTMLGTILIVDIYVFKRLNPKEILLTAGIYFFIPLTIMGEAGWIATTLNYSWPVLFSLLAFYPFFEVYQEKKPSVVMIIVSSLFLIFAANQEQINICFFTLTLIVSLTIIKLKKYNLKLLLLSIISFAELLFSVLSPGNIVRYNKEIVGWFPQYKNFSIVNKIDLGISSFGKPFFLENNFMFMILFLLITLLVYRNKTGYFLKLLSMIPLILNLVIWLGNTINPTFLKAGGLGIPLLSSAGINKLFTNFGTDLSFYHPSTWLPTMMILGLLICTGCGLYLSFENQMQAIFSVLLLLMAFSSRLILGFSPTVWASGVRTYFITFIVSFILILMLLKELNKTISHHFQELISLTLTGSGAVALLLELLSR